MPWPQDAYVGQKVVCVDGTTPEHGNWGPIPIQGVIYTISKIGFVFNNTGRTGIGFNIFELDRDEDPGLDLCWWRASRFRPVQSTSTGYAILAKLQNPANHPMRISEDA
ncbi:MAG: hypothetical protein KGL39_60340 [Patescibacteria group bacterium]|nr:hypothetical protein [Patescibacteria group bacterium]